MGRATKQAMCATGFCVIRSGCYMPGNTSMTTKSCGNASTHMIVSEHRTIAPWLV